MVQRRDLVTAIILTVITCGLYGIYWMICLNDDVNLISGNTQDPTGGTVFLISLVTCGIYGLYWSYKMGEKLDNEYASRGAAPQSRGILYIILSLFGFSVVAYVLMQDSINKLL